MKVRNTNAERADHTSRPAGRPPLFDAPMTRRHIAFPDPLWMRVIGRAAAEGVSAAEWVRRAVVRAVKGGGQ